MSKKECPWCSKELVLAESEHVGSHGTMKVVRCVSCNCLISVRLKGEPDEIIKKGFLKEAKA